MDEVSNLSGGWSGTDATVDRIYRLVDESLVDPLVVRTARSLVRNVAERDQAAESRAISAYVRAHIRYTRETVETLAAPREMIQDIQANGKTTGDCDEFTTLSLALHRIIGIPVRAVVISQRKDGLASHIFGQALINGQWVTMDDIVKSKPYGWASPASNRTKTKVYDMAGLGEVGWSGHKEGSRMKGTMIVGRTRMTRSDVFRPRRHRMLSHSVASRGYRLKPSGTLYVGKDGQISGVGVDPQLGLDFSSLIETAITAGGKYAETKLGQPKAQSNPIPTAPRSQVGGVNTTTLLLFGGGAAALWWFFKK